MRSASLTSLFLSICFTIQMTYALDDAFLGEGTSHKVQTNEEWLTCEDPATPYRVVIRLTVTHEGLKVQGELFENEKFVNRDPDCETLPVGFPSWRCKLVEQMWAYVQNNPSSLYPIIRVEIGGTPRMSCPVESEILSQFR